MTSSGTFDFSLNMTEAIEEAYDRAMGSDNGGPRSGYDMRTARRSINLMLLDWSNRGLNMFTYLERVQVLTYNTGEYFLGADIVDVIEQVVQLPPGSTGSQVSRVNMSRVSVSTQATRTNPTVTGRPTEVYYHRGVDGITANIWPLPDGSGPYTLIYHVLRRIEDAGAYSNTPDLPFRFLPVFIAGLAYYIAAKKRQDNPQLVLWLESKYEEAWTRAADEDRDRSVLSIVPRPSSYRVA